MVSAARKCPSAPEKTPRLPDDIDGTAVNAGPDCFWPSKATGRLAIPQIVVADSLDEQQRPPRPALHPATGN